MPMRCPPMWRRTNALKGPLPGPSRSWSATVRKPGPSPWRTDEETASAAPAAQPCGNRHRRAGTAQAGKTGSTPRKAASASVPDGSAPSFSPENAVSSFHFRTGPYRLTDCTPHDRTDKVTVWNRTPREDFPEAVPTPADAARASKIIQLYLRECLSGSI
ncbi:MAG: hypothetical protein ACLT8E_11110 [Akkermansia sp.]